MIEFDSNSAYSSKYKSVFLRDLSHKKLRGRHFCPALGKIGLAIYGLNKLLGFIKF